MSEKNKLFVPKLDDIIEIHSALDFVGGDCYIGVNLVAEGEDGQIVKKTFFITNNGLIDNKKLLEKHITLTKPLTYHKQRMSSELLKFLLKNPRKVELYSFFQGRRDGRDIGDESKRSYNYINRWKYKETLQTLPLNHSSITIPVKFKSGRVYEPRDFTLPETHGKIEYENTEEVVDSKEKLYKLYKIIKSKLQQYVELGVEFYDVVALWIMGTYFYPLFTSYPYLYFGGVKRSGKTSALTLIEKMAFNTIPSGSLTASTVFRIINGARPTLLIDETDTLVSSKNSPELRQVLLNGYKSGYPVLRSVQRGDLVDFDVATYDVYCPKALANIAGLDNILEDRAITIIMQRTLNKDFSDKLCNINNDNWQEIRDYLYIMLIYCFKEVKEEYNNMYNNFSLINRDWELWKPLLSIAKLVFNDFRYKEFVEVALKICAQKSLDDITEAKESLLMHSLLMVVDEDRFYKVKEIKDKMVEIYGEEQEWINARSIGRTLKRLGFENKRLVNGKTEYNLNSGGVERVANKLGLLTSKQQQDTDKVIIEEKETKFENNIQRFIVNKLLENDGKPYSIIRLLEKDAVIKFGKHNYDLCFTVYSDLRNDGIILNSDSLDKVVINKEKAKSLLKTLEETVDVTKDMEQYEKQTIEQYEKPDKQTHKEGLEKFVDTTKKTKESEESEIQKAMVKTEQKESFDNATDRIKSKYKDKIVSEGELRDELKNVDTVKNMDDFDRLIEKIRSVGFLFEITPGRYKVL